MQTTVIRSSQLPVKNIQIFALCFYLHTFCDHLEAIYLVMQCNVFHLLCRHHVFPLMTLKERLINSCSDPQGFSDPHQLPRLSCEQPAHGERVCALHSLIGSCWSHALFLVPRRTCFIALSPHTASDQTEITGLLVLDCLFNAFNWGKEKEFQCFFNTH